MMPGTLTILLLLAAWVGADGIPLQEGVESGVMLPNMDTPSVPLSPRSPRVGGGRRTTVEDFLHPAQPFQFLPLRQGPAAVKIDESRDTSDGRRRSSKWKGSRVVTWSKLMPNPQGFLALYG
ncbi:uncharacterized protein [Branchiostoma lanceolatum]|uniref:uncharacterized protein n=1 Tax=Branchiostoma lanceolatum TaxID=7740 RepID=UPI003452B1A5